MCHFKQIVEPQHWKNHSFSILNSSISTLATLALAG